MTHNFEMYVKQEDFEDRHTHGELQTYITSLKTNKDYLVYFYIPEKVIEYAKSTRVTDLPSIVIPNPVFVKDLELETLRAAAERGVDNFFEDFLPIDFLTPESKQKKLRLF
jgi:hypothetical protein